MNMTRIRREAPPQSVLLSEEEMAMEDALTGLPNHRAAFEKLRELEERGAPFVLAYLDLNRFKEINDTCGHQAGDAVLQETARRLRAVSGRSAFIARIGGDEFIVILSQSFQNRAETERAFAAAKDAMGREFPFQKRRLDFSISVGLALFPQDADNVEKLASLADKAMYEDKRRDHDRMAHRARGDAPRRVGQDGKDDALALRAARL